jgi:8-oxo-dGTP diphosphatase
MAEKAEGDDLGENMKDKKNPGVGFGVMLLKDGKVLLGKRNDDPEKASSLLHGEGTWTMPGGKLDFGETLAAGARRELFEETGLRAGGLSLISLADDMKGSVHFVTAGFLCEEFSGVPKAREPEEITEWRWFTLRKLPEKVFPPSKKILDNFAKGVVYDADD